LLNNIDLVSVKEIGIMRRGEKFFFYVVKTVTLFQTTILAKCTTDFSIAQILVTCWFKNLVVCLETSNRRAMDSWDSADERSEGIQHERRRGCRG
jgi:hypothetical protein